MKFDPVRKCVVADDGSLLEMSGKGNGCRGHDSVLSGNKYKCAASFCAGDYQAWLVRQLYGESVRRKTVKA